MNHEPHGHRIGREWLARQVRKQSEQEIPPEFAERIEAYLVRKIQEAVPREIERQARDSGNLSPED